MRTVLLIALTAIICTAASATAATVITGRQIKDGTVTGRDIKNRSLSVSEFKRPSRLQGAPGPAGPVGPSGPPGQSGLLALTTAQTDTVITRVEPGRLAQLWSYCPNNMKAIAGSYDLRFGTGRVPLNQPRGNAWLTTVINEHPNETLVARSYALCAA